MNNLPCQPNAGVPDHLDAMAGEDRDVTSAQTETAVAICMTTIMFDDKAGSNSHRDINYVNLQECAL